MRGDIRADVMQAEACGRPVPEAAPANPPAVVPAPAPQPVPRRRSEPLAWGMTVAVVPYFAIKGWLNAAIVPLGLFAIFALARTARGRLRGLHASVWWMVAALLAPLFAVAIVQVAHGQFVPKYFDAPVRLALGAALLLLLYVWRVDWTPHLRWAAPAAVLICGLIVGWPGADAFYWQGGRVATYFMDPLTLSQHVAIMGFLCLYLMDSAQSEHVPLKALHLFCLACAVAIAISTGSRTGWVMMPLLAVLYLVGLRRWHDPRGIALSLVLIVVACVLLYAFSSKVQLRMDEAWDNIAGYFNGGKKDTSEGVRVTLYRIAWTAFLDKPWFGWGFAQLPQPAAMPGIAPLYTETVRFFFVTAGVHNEVLQAMMKMGLPGLVSRLMLLLVPLWLFARAALAREPRRRQAGYLGLVVVIGYLTAGMTSEVFNLVYIASFFGMLVAPFAALALPRPTSA